MRPQILYRVFKNFKLNTENPAYSAHLLTVLLLKFPRYCAHLAKIRDTQLRFSLSGLGKGDVKIFVSPETLKVQKETLPTEEGLFLVSY